LFPKRDAVLVTIFVDAAGDYLNRHADAHRLIAQVGELGGDGGPSASLTSATI